jgi:hypothetical protein
MKTLTPVIALALISLAAPAAAQPVEATVRGGRIIYSPPSVVRPWPFYDNYYPYRNPPGSNFDPALASIAANEFAFGRRARVVPVNIDRAITLARTGDSMVAHQLKCQAQYPTYDLISDTYLVRGIPWPCRL